jgi:prepilin-type N-terminal cleavage/methylation domain-containing protein
MGHARGNSGPASAERHGFSLIEVVVAMTILAIVLLSLARLSVVVSQRGRANDILAKRTAVLQGELNKFGAMSFATLSAFSTAPQTVTAGNYTYTRRLAINAVGSKRVTVTIVVVPAQDTLKKDSVTFDRSRSGSSPLCTGC